MHACLCIAALPPLRTAAALDVWPLRSPPLAQDALEGLFVAAAAVFLPRRTFRRGSWPGIPSHCRSGQPAIKYSAQ